VIAVAVLGAESYWLVMTIEPACCTLVVAIATPFCATVPPSMVILPRGV
jgi:hypothetical protein